MNIVQSQHIGYNLCAKYKMNFNKEVQSIHFQLNMNEDDVDKSTYKEKWFSHLTIQVNGNDALEYSYEMLCLHKSCHSLQLPNGVFEIPNVNYLNWGSNDIQLCFYNMDQSMNENMKVSICAELNNYVICGSQFQLVYEA